MIPFNKPHGLLIQEITPESTKVMIPYKRKNMNHLKGLHACVLITGAEYCSGLVLLQHLPPKSYRLIMKELSVEYHYQAKMESFAQFGLSREELNRQLGEGFQSTGVGDVQCDVSVSDAKGNSICTVTTHWQIKDWSKVKTKV